MLRSGAGPLVVAPAAPLEDLAAVQGAVRARRDLEAAGLAFGAACAGQVPTLAVSGAGLARIGEVVSAACAAELPMVVVACSRSGPGAGNDYPAQTDYHLATRAPGPGGAATPVFAPWSPREAGRLLGEALSWASRERTPVLVLLDALVARTREAVDPDGFEALPVEGVDDLSGRGLAGSAPTSREAAEALSYKLWEKARGWEGRGVLDEVLVDDAEVLLVAYGSAARIAVTTVEKARKRGVRLGLARPRTLRPFPSARLGARLAQVRAALVVELCEGQMVEDVRRLAPATTTVGFYGRMGGAAPTPFELMHQIQSLVGSL